VSTRSLEATKLDWRNIRVLRDSQDFAFEQICVQVAEHEPFPKGSVFHRKGAPDSGVECYWVDPQGNDHAWQAKYWTSPPNPKQWNDLDDSVERALRGHPDLRAYYVCIPIDEQDPRIGRKYFKDKWDARVAKWRQRSKQIGHKDVTFSFWGAGTLEQRLYDEKHHGRLWLFFNEKVLSPEWFQKQYDILADSIHGRYDPLLNVDVPLNGIFRGLTRDLEFLAQLNTSVAAISRASSEIRDRELPKAKSSSIETVRNCAAAMRKWLNDIIVDFVVDIDLASPDEYAKKMQDATARLQSHYEAMSQKHADEGGERRSDPYSYQRYKLNNLAMTLFEFRRLVGSTEMRMAAHPRALVVGAPGSGKTHLFADIASRWLSGGGPALMFLGQHFVDSDPWAQIRNQLDLSQISLDHFLGALEAAAEISGKRALILIDAINEPYGTGPITWRKHLASFLAKVKHRRRIAVALSVRSSYESIITETLPTGALERVVHHGFSGVEEAALEKYFAHFRIRLPDAPLLVPEFSNPLFLRTICIAMQNEGYTEFPRGLHGLTEIFNFYVDSINKKLRAPERLAYPQHRDLVREASQVITRLLISRELAYATVQDVEVALGSIWTHNERWESSLLGNLVNEGLLTIDCYPNAVGDEVVRFTYERFFDYFAAMDLLDGKGGGTQLQAATERLADPHWVYGQSGTLEVLAVMLAERFSVEITAFSTKVTEFAIQSAFASSVIWRAPNAISSKTISECRKLRGNSFNRLSFYDILLTLTPMPLHPLNAAFLDNHLASLDMSERDAQWTIYLNTNAGGPANRLVRWARTAAVRSMPDDVRELMATAICWLFTSSNRPLRDRATKALVALLQDRPHLSVRLLERFCNVNDPYVLERLAAAIYGAVLRTQHDEELSLIARKIYELFFAKGKKPPVHILTRDYARNIIERAAELDAAGLKNLDLSRCRPPYGASWQDPPTKQSLERRLADKRSPGLTSGKRAIYRSIFGDRDFARYTLRGDRHQLSFTITPLGSPTITPQMVLDKFYGSLTRRQLAALQRQKEASQEETRISMRRVLRKRSAKVRGKDEEQAALAARSAKDAFLRSLTAQQRREYLHEVIYAEGRHSTSVRLHSEVLQCAVAARTLALGWTAKLFGYHDTELVDTEFYHERPGHERIGQKYSWIAYHESLARLADNFTFAGEVEGAYEGPWQLGARDIDPSFDIFANELCYGIGTPWTDEWHTIAEKEARSFVRDHLEEAKSIYRRLLSTNSDGRNWITLQGQFSWEEPPPVGMDRHDVGGREFWLKVQGYFVPRRAATRWISWARNANLSQVWMPESAALDEIFQTEFYWSPAFASCDKPYYNQPSWIQSDEVSAQLLVSSTGYASDAKRRDFSLAESIENRMPVKDLAKYFDLKWDIGDYWIDQAGRRVAFCPYFQSTWPTPTLSHFMAVDEESLREFLEQRKLDLVWTFFGEKRTLPGNIMSHSDFDRSDWECVTGAGRLGPTTSELFISTATPAPWEQK
jgi:hypothetical protein